jgi:histidine triad (HIT) family protein
MKSKVGKYAFAAAKSPLGDLIVGLALGKFSKLLSVKRIEDTNKAIAFWHPKPFWEKHILIVTKKPIKKITELKYGDMKYVNECFKVTKKIAIDLKLEEKGYTLIANGGSRQGVNQLHFHLTSGEELK